MPARASSFLKIEILIALLVVPLLTAGCGPKMVWGVPVEELKAELARADYARLAAVDFASQDPSESLGLGPEAPFYLSYVFDSIGKQDKSLRMLELAWARSPKPWKDEAGLALCQRYIAQKSWAQAIGLARDLLSARPSADHEQRARRMLVEALYWNKDDEETLAEAEKLSSPDAEVLLFRAVSSLRLDRGAARELILQLFIHERVSPLHGRVYTFLAAEPRYLERFSEVEKDLLAAKYHLAQGTWAKGLALMESVLERVDPALIGDGVLVVDLGNSYGYAGKQAAGAAFIEKIARKLSGQARVDALEQSGKLLRKAKEFAKALTMLRSAAGEVRSADQSDRIRWYILDILLTQAPADLSSQLEKESAAWREPEYFSDLLAGAIADRVAAKDWRTLAGMWRALMAKGPATISGQLCYILGRARQEGLLARLPGSPAATARAFFRLALQSSPTGYYGVLAASVLGEPPLQTAPRAPQPGDPDTAALDPLILGFLPFGLTTQAYARLADAREKLSDAQLLEAARQLAKAGDIRSSMYLAGALARRRTLTAQELELQYPRAYNSLIDGLASSSGVASHVLYGLIREESFFDPDIVSSAGAIGLSQLMPSTAAQVAQSLRMQDPTSGTPRPISPSARTTSRISFPASTAFPRPFSRTMRGSPGFARGRRRAGGCRSIFLSNRSPSRRRASTYARFSSLRSCTRASTTGRTPARLRFRFSA